MTIIPDFINIHQHDNSKKIFVLHLTSTTAYDIQDILFSLLYSCHISSCHLSLLSQYSPNIWTVNTSTLQYLKINFRSWMSQAAVLFRCKTKICFQLSCQLWLLIYTLLRYGLMWCAKLCNVTKLAQMKDH